MILLIVFLPLLAAIVAGLGNRMIGNVPAKLVTTGALFVSCALSWPVFFHYLGRADASIIPVFDFIRSGEMNAAWELRVATSAQHRDTQLEPLVAKGNRRNVGASCGRDARGLAPVAAERAADGVDEEALRLVNDFGRKLSEPEP